MKYSPEIHHRRSIRLQNYNYFQAGAYFITICTHNREHLFGEIVNGEMYLNDLGKITQFHWQHLTKHYLYLKLDEFIIMPNHFHGIIFLDWAGLEFQDRAGFVHELLPLAQISAKPAPTDTAPTDTAYTEPATAKKRKGIPEILRGFKTFSAININRVRSCKNTLVWQRNYYERIVRSEQELQNVREYIMNNPQEWARDENNIL